MAEEVGITARLEHVPVHTSADELHALLVQLNHDQAIHGILVQMPLPAHLSHTMVAATIAPSKDIDGISPLSAGNLLLGLPGFLSSTAAAVMEMLERTRTSLEGRQVVIIKHHYLPAIDEVFLDGPILEHDQLVLEKQIRLSYTSGVEVHVYPKDLFSPLR